MPPIAVRLCLWSALLFAGWMVATALRSHNAVSISILTAPLLMFALCCASSARLLGPGAAMHFAAIATSLGWFAEQMGASRGWFFGGYSYTDLLGPRLGEVPLVIPLMWFALTYARNVPANLIVWQSPVPQNQGSGSAILLSFIAAIIVTTFDLEADRYLVNVPGAREMHKKNGAWFGETVQGFWGGVFISFCIIASFCWSVYRSGLARPPWAPRRYAVVPLALYGTGKAFQVVRGHPMEIRSIAPFAMGIPLLCALAGQQRWQAAVEGVFA